MEYFYSLDLVRLDTRIHAEEHSIPGPEDLCKFTQELGSLIAMKVAYSDTLVNTQK